MPRWCLLAGLLMTLLVGCEAVDPQAELEKASAAIAEKLPLTIDEHTTLLEVQAEDLEVVYLYEVTGLTDEELQERIETLKETAKTHLAANKPALTFFARYKIPLTYVCRNEAGDEMVRFSIAPWDL